MYADAGGASQPLQQALRLAFRCICEHRFRDLDREFREAAQPKGEGSFSEAGVAGGSEGGGGGDGAGDGAGDEAGDAPRQPLPLSCGLENHLRFKGSGMEEPLPDSFEAAATAVAAAEAGEVVTKEGEEARRAPLVPPKAVWPWGSLPTFQVGAEGHAQVGGASPSVYTT